MLTDGQDITLRSSPSQDSVHVCLDAESLLVLTALEGTGNYGRGHLGHLVSIVEEPVEVPYNEISRTASKKASRLDCGDVNNLAFALEGALGETTSPENLRPHMADFQVAPCECEVEWVCGICLEDAAEDSAAVLDRLPCKHVFHRLCLSEWLANHSSCPTCRGLAPRAAMDFSLIGPAWDVSPSAVIGFASDDAPDPFYMDSPEVLALDCKLDGSAWPMLPNNVVFHDIARSGMADSPRGASPHLDMNRSFSRFSRYNPNFFESASGVDLVNWEWLLQRKRRNSIFRSSPWPWGIGAHVCILTSVLPPGNVFRIFLS